MSVLRDRRATDPTRKPGHSAVKILLYIWSSTKGKVLLLKRKIKDKKGKIFTSDEHNIPEKIMDGEELLKSF